MAAAAAAAQQAGQQRGPGPGSARGRGGLLVGGHPGGVRLVLLLGDVGRQPARQQHQPLIAALHHAAGVRAARDLAARVDLAAAEGVVPGIGRVVQHVLQRLPGRAPPFQLPLRRARPGPDRQLHLVLHEVAEHGLRVPNSSRICERSGARRAAPARRGRGPPRRRRGADSRWAAGTSNSPRSRLVQLAWPLVSAA